MLLGELRLSRGDLVQAQPMLELSHLQREATNPALLHRLRYPGRAAATSYEPAARIMDFLHRDLQDPRRAEADSSCPGPQPLRLNRGGFLSVCSDSAVSYA